MSEPAIHPAVRELIEIAARLALKRLRERQAAAAAGVPQPPKLPPQRPAA